MDNLQLHQMQSQFDTLAKRVPDENIEFWFARDLQEPFYRAKKILLKNMSKIMKAFVTC